MRLRYLRVNPKAAIKTAKPCASELHSLLACWRMNGVDAGACAVMVAALAACSSAAAISAKKDAHQLAPSINFMLGKMFKARNL